MSRLKILAIAYACNPTRGSEYGVGWGWISSIARHHDVTVITADFNRSEIESFFAKQPSSVRLNATFLYVRNRLWHYRPQGQWLKIENSIIKPLMNLAYQDWLRCAHVEARREIADSRYDLVHLITF